MSLTTPPAADPDRRDLALLLAWLTEEACQAANSEAPHAAGMLTWAALVVSERLDEDAPDPPTTDEVAELVEWLRQLSEMACTADEASRLDRVIALLSQRHPKPVPVSEREVSAIEALRRLRRWWGLSGAGYSAEVVQSITDWIDGGMVGPLPPFPAHANVLPPPAEEQP